MAYSATSASSTSPMPNAVLVGKPSVANACETGAGISRWPMLSNNMNAIASVLSILPVQVIVPPVALATDGGGSDRQLSDGAGEVAASEGVTDCATRRGRVRRSARGEGRERLGVASDQLGDRVVRHVEYGVVRTNAG